MDELFTEFSDSHRELIQLLNLMAIQLAVADRVVTDLLPSATRLFQRLQVLGAEIDRGTRGDHCLNKGE